ncbi:hypothetical protein XENTR_v10004832 [Xenopus tropicalis]|uniref:Bromodomain and WD repeat domain-containing 1 n=1 Tax=Xenopus tropicalis TaxID=8364 RepID=A0A6I8RHF5_XENTR|nr:bromodomain and WD repeat-containing protein 1 [Xenopus tropicalis]KAE8621436.1 hypothetical protein XENTR_v10004832 [Xenopus tropicalis]|eukprot:XP_012813493.1 PREDICTED: bromodomain and WD repeat-containing protein 1 [Xenopus tropicalis]
MAEPPGPSRSPQQLETELHFLIARFLSNGPYHKTAEVLIRQMNESKAFPKRLDWLGNEHGRSFEEMVSANNHVSSDHLLKICQHLGSLLDNITPCNVQTGSLLGAGKQSLLRTEKGCKNVQWNRQMLAALHRGRPPEMPINIRFPPNAAVVHYGKRLTGTLSITSGFPVQLYQHMKMHRRILGHRSSVYCVAFDRTGHRIFTGADDGLVKIWSTHDGRLIATLRGHSAEVSELTVNYENTLIAAASCEKIIRVWSLRTCAPVAVLQGHSISVTSLLFSPLVDGSMRYLISTGGDATVCCWEWDVDTLQFKDQPIKFTEKSGPGAQMLCCSCSAGGMYLATGGSDRAIRIYFFGCETPKKLIQLEGHNDIIDSVQFANSGERFVSGSNDGTARIWYLHEQNWKSIRLDMREGDKDSEEEEQLTRPKVLMITWDLTDATVVTASNLRSLKVWESRTGKLLRVLSGHQNDIYVLEPHPFDSRVMISAGYDGKIIIWDVNKGDQIKCYCNTIEHEGHGAILDCKLSVDGQHIASTDSHGHLLIFGFGCSKPYEKIPDEMFFHTDYRPLCIDGNHYVLDEQTQLAPHLMPPAFLVDSDGNPHEPKFQRLVPGRENFEDEHLIPQLGYMETSDGEIVEQVIGQQASDDLQNAEPSSQEGMRPPQIADGQRRDASSSPSTGSSRNGQAQGVRQSQSSSPQSQTSADRDYLAWRRRVVVPELERNVYRQQEASRLERGREEKAYFAKQILQPSVQETHLPTERQNARSIKRPKCRSPSPRPDVEQFLDLSCEEGEETESRGSEEEISTVDDTSSTASTDKEEEWRSEESSEYSDWTVDAGINLQPPSRISTRRRVKTIMTSSEEESSAEERLSTPKKRRPKQRHSDSEMQSPGRPLSDRENPTDFHPPLWITDTLPRRSPFVPQMGDDVIYFRQGHEAYINVVRRNNLSILKKLKEPWKHVILRDQELVKIVGIRYEVGPPSLCCLKLALIDHVTGKFIDQSFSLKYHDMPDVIDFLVLKQFYDQSCQTNWHPGDRFRSIIDDAWWFGTVMDQEPYQSDYPDSLFQCYTVKWDNTEVERLSPWDMEIIPAYVSPPSELGTSISLNSDELEELLYVPQKGEWGNGDRDSECERVICGIDQILQMEFASQFAAPVDLTTYPIYSSVVSYPTDLSTIRMRLVNRFYRRLSALIWEVRYIELNARAFNEPDSSIAKSAKIITDLLLRFIMDSRCTNISDLCNAAEGDEEEEESADEQKQKRKDKMAKSKEDAWRMQCMELANSVLENEDSEPFREPVDLYEYPDYLDIIETPRDFGTITECLALGGYNNPFELRKDMRLVFSNAKRYTPDRRSKIHSMVLRLSEFVESRMDAIISEYKAAYSCKQAENDLNYLKSTSRNVKQRRLISESENESGQEPCSSRSTSSEVFSNNSRDSIASTSGASSYRDVLGKPTASAAKSAPVIATSSSSSSSASSGSETDSSSSTSDSEHSSGSEKAESNKKSVSNSHAGKVSVFVKSVDPAKRNGRTTTTKQESQGNRQQNMTSSKRRHNSDSEESVPKDKAYSTSRTQKKMLRKCAALAANKIKCMSDTEGSMPSSDSDCREGKGSRTLPRRAAATEAKKHLMDGSGEENTLKSDNDRQPRMEQSASNVSALCASKAVSRRSDSSGSESRSKSPSSGESSISDEIEDDHPVNGENSDQEMSEPSIADTPYKHSATSWLVSESDSEISSTEDTRQVTKQKHYVPKTKIAAERNSSSKNTNKETTKKDLTNCRKNRKKYTDKANEWVSDSTDSDSEAGVIKRKVRKKVVFSLTSPARKTKVTSDSEDTLDSEDYGKFSGSDEEIPQSKSIKSTESSSESSSSSSDSGSSLSDASSHHERKVNGKTVALKPREPEGKRKRTKSSCDDDWEELNYRQRKKLTRRAKIPTRNRGKRTVRYDDVDSEETVSRTKSTNRRLRKISARASARQFFL